MQEVANILGETGLARSKDAVPPFYSPQGAGERQSERYEAIYSGHIITRSIVNFHEPP